MAVGSLKARLAGGRRLRPFFTVLAGQFVSLLGSKLTGFALGVYIYQRTGSTTQFALAWLFATLPNIFVSPIAGTLVDRWDRRLVTLLADVGAALSTGAVAVLFLLGRLEVWHIYLASAAGATFGTFHTLAYGAAVPLLVPKGSLGRVNGLIQFGAAASDIAAPLLAGMLVVAIGLGGVILIDVATFGVAVLTLALVRFPRPETSEEGRRAGRSLFGGAAYGWRFILTRPGLIALLLLSASVLVLGGVTEVLIGPLVLAFAPADRLGLVLSLGGVGMLAGGFVMTAWGGPKRLVRGIFLFELAAAAATLSAGLRPSVPLIGASVLALFFTYPILDSCAQTIWQTKVPPDMLGRVFAARRTLQWLPVPFALVGVGPLVDRVLEPLLAPEGSLAGSVGRAIGIGPGRGIGLLFVGAGVLNVLAAVAAYSYPGFRHLERELPDALPGRAAG